MRLVRNFCALLLLFSPFLSIGGDGDALVKKESATLKTQFGDIVCQKGMSFKVTNKGAEDCEVSGDCFGFPVVGTMKIADLDFSPASSEAQKSPAENEPPPANPESAAGKEKDAKGSASKQETPESKPVSVSYMGKNLSGDFVQFFHSRLKEDYCLKNLDSQELLLKDKVPVVNSADDCAGLAEHDIVVLEGNLVYAEHGVAALAIFNELYTFQDCFVALFRDINSPPPKGRSYKAYASFGSSKEVPPIGEGRVRFKFEELDEKDLFIPIKTFSESLESGKEYQMKCPKCEGKGNKKDIKGRNQRCTNCRGTGLLSPEATLNNTDAEFKKKGK